MTRSDVLDQTALACARPYMAKVAWPTVILGLVLWLSYVASIAMALMGVLSLWLAFPIVVAITYASYTVAHDSVHGSISGNNRSLRWLTKALGYMAAWTMMIPLTAHRHEHMAHHRDTNDPEHDPDFPVSRMGDSVAATIHATLQITLGQFSHYFKHRWKTAPAKQNLVLCLEVAAAMIPRLAIVFSGYWLEGLVLFVLAWFIGVVILLYLFAYIVHRPHERTGRYVDTSTILLPGPLGTLLTWLWLFQNYHSIHHLFPRVPFYQYAKLYEEIEEVLVTKGAPVYRVTARGLQPLSEELIASNEYA